MKWQITVKPNARQERVEKVGEAHLLVAVNAPPTEGKANEAVIRALSLHFRIRKSSIRILKGFKGRKKIVEIDTF